MTVMLSVNLNLLHQKGRRQTPEELNMSETVPALAMTGFMRRSHSRPSAEVC